MAETAEQAWAPKWSVGERIRKAREDKGWHQSELAFQLQVGRATIANWENNVNKPNHASLMLVGAVTGCPVWWLEGFDGPVTDPSGGIPTVERRKRGRDLVVGSSGWSPPFAGCERRAA
jgi:transcriptional regulator with XRE-family HTH domain